jgi:hypothetical protein
MRKMFAFSFVVALLLAAAPGWATDSNPNSPAKQGSVWCGEAPRFQIFQASGRYGGLIMLDTRTGESYQRVITNTDAGIEIKWLRLERVKEMPANQVIIWE